ncbi:MAG TPA: response regulator [Bacteroidales bacterium]
METNNRRILIIDHNPKNIELLTDALSKFGFSCVAAGDYQAIDNLLAAPAFDIILIDIAGFDTDIWDRCKTIHKLQIPFLILSSKPSPVLHQHGIRYGARGIVSKPVILKDFVKLINSLINET